MPEEVSASSYEGLDQSFEGWIAECLNDTEMNTGPDDMYASLVCSILFELLPL